MYFSISVFQQNAAGEAHGAHGELFEGTGHCKWATQISSLC